MGMFGKLKGKIRDQEASDALVEDIEGLTAMEEASEPLDPPDEAAVPSPSEAGNPLASLGEEEEASAIDDTPLDDDILSMFEEEEDAGDPTTRELAAEVEDLNTEELLNDILSLTEDLNSI
jgi:hypothetical protein